jgi:hypothetical protein
MVGPMVPRDTRPGLNAARYVTTVDVAVPHAPTRTRGRLLNDNSTLRAETGIGSTRSEHANNGWSGDFTPIDGDGSLGVVAVARWGFAPPVPGSRVELIVGELIADTTVDLDELATLEFAPETEAVVSSVDQIPADDEPRDEARPDDAQVARDELPTRSTTRLLRLLPPTGRATATTTSGQGQRRSGRCPLARWSTAPEPPTVGRSVTDGSVRFAAIVVEFGRRGPAAAGAEEVPQQFTCRCLVHAADHLDAVVERRVIEQSEVARDRARLRVVLRRTRAARVGRSRRLRRTSRTARA